MGLQSSSRELNPSVLLTFSFLLWLGSQPMELLTFGVGLFSYCSLEMPLEMYRLGSCFLSGSESY